MKSIINGKKRTFYTESGFNLVPRAFPPLSFSKKNVLGTRLGVIVVEVGLSRFCSEKAKKLLRNMPKSCSKVAQKFCKVARIY